MSRPAVEAGVGAAHTRAAPDTRETKKAISWRTPRRRGLTGSLAPAGSVSATGVLGSAISRDRRR